MLIIFVKKEIIFRKKAIAFQTYDQLEKLKLLLKVHLQ